MRPWEELREQVVLGAAGFARGVKRRVGAARGKGAGSREGVLGRWLREPVELKKVIAAVEKARGERWEDFRDRHGDSGRDLVLYLARKATGLTASALAREVGLKQHANVSMAVKRYERRMLEDKTVRKAAAAAAEMLHVTL